MKISLNEIKKYVDIDISTDELIKLIGSRLVEVEGSEDLSKKYKGIKIAKVIKCEHIPDTHLSLCQINIGNEDNIQVVCGAPNVRQGMLVVWLAPGCIVPATFGNENFELSIRKLRGHESNGMLAALDELDLGLDHDGIVEINPDDAHPGDDFADVFDLNDIVLDIENKSLTHRPDCFGLIGFAREVAGILGKKFIEPEFLTYEEVFPEGFLEENDQNGVSSKNCSIEINIQNPELCPRYSCAVIEINNNLTDKKYLTKDDIFLAKADMHGISKIVDISNILMLKTGQPLHTFDYDKFITVGGTNNPKIGVRLAKAGEKLELLDGKIIECTNDDLLVTSNDMPVALAGAMGGANTEIDGNTKKVLIESASFSLYNLRKTQMHHGIFSEAITRFTKGIPAGGTFNIMAEAVKELGGEAVEVCDSFVGWKKADPIQVSVEDINKLLGANYDANLIVKTLENVNIICEKNGPSDFSVFAPYWRTDLHIKEDIIEEVGRLLGYDNIGISYPKRSFIGAKISPILALKTKIRNILSDNLNAHEVLTYSFINEKLISLVGQRAEDSYKIVNSISPDLQYFRQHITPSLIDKLRENIKAGHEKFTIYEFNQVSGHRLGLDDDGAPRTTDHLAILSFGDFYKIKKISTELFKKLNIKISIKNFSHQEAFPYLEPLHAADIYIADEYVGSIGEVKSQIVSRFKVNDQISVFETNLAQFLGKEESAIKKLKISKFPFVHRDITVKVHEEITFEEIQSAVENVFSEKDLIHENKPISIYQPKSDQSSRNISFRLSFSDTQKTLQPEDISAIMEQINKALQSLGAEVV